MGRLVGKDAYFSLFTALLLFGVSLYLGLVENNPLSPECADVIFFGGTIWSGSGEQVEAISVLGDRISNIGSYQDITDEYCLEKTIMISLKGKMLTPGWIDSHVHTLLGGLHLLSVGLHDCHSHEMILQRVEEYIEEVGEGEWIVGSGWNEERFRGAEAGVPPTRFLLDTVSPKNPVWLCRMDWHRCVTNTLGLKLAGIDLLSPPKISGGIIEIDPQTKTVNGIMKDNAMEIIMKVIPEVPEAKQEKALQSAMNYFVSHGVTSITQVVNDIYSDVKETWDLFEKIALKNEVGQKRFKIPLPLHTTPFTRTYFAPALSTSKEVSNLMKSSSRAPSDYLRLGAVKGFFDGSLGSKTAKMHEPYADNKEGEEENSGLLLVSEQDMLRWVTEADALDLQVVVHAIGSEAVEKLLDVYERVSSENPSKDRRFRIEHCQNVKAREIKRIQQLNVIASIQPYHMVDDALFMYRALGKRSEDAYPMRSLLDNNATIIFGSDWNVAPASPLLGIHAAVTRSYLDLEGNRQQFVVREQITVEEALHAYTTAAAFGEFKEHEKGMIKKGFLADFVIIDQVITEIDPFDIPRTNVDLTMIGGRIVYESESMKENIIMPMSGYLG